ncbi:MAG: hypothetical protein HY619_04055 [Thaumarchaeota archaeon]|nr:hypothetical protein [Nitrososphaerota archaeon]
MPLSQNMTMSQMRDYLISDLRRSVENDVLPCLRPAEQEGGYFAIPRLVLGYVDYLGALYHGYARRPHPRTNRRILASGNYAVTFLNDVFGAIDPNYRTRGKLLWEIYRNGTIHLYQPLTLENAGRTIEWLTYKGPRRGTLTLGTQTINVEHLVPSQVSVTMWVQPISTICLYEDLLEAIDHYATLIQGNSILENKFRQVANALLIPEPTNVVW